MINFKKIEEYCFTFNGVESDFPFDHKVITLKVANKMFLLCDLEKTPLSINLKCDPDLALDLREQHDFIIPGYHMNKKHWNTVIIEKMDDFEFLKWMIRNSYDLIFNKLTKKEQFRINNLI